MYLCTSCIHLRQIDSFTPTSTPYSLNLTHYPTGGKKKRIKKNQSRENHRCLPKTAHQHLLTFFFFMVCYIYCQWVTSLSHLTGRFIKELKWTFVKTMKSQKCLLVLKYLLMSDVIKRFPISAVLPQWLEEPLLLFLLPASDMEMFSVSCRPSLPFSPHHHLV